MTPASSGCTNTTPSAAVVSPAPRRLVRWRASAVGATLAAALLLGACGNASDFNDPKRPTQVVATVSDKITTVVKVSWTTDVPTTGYVEYGLTPSFGGRTPIESAETKTHTATVLGLSADTPYFYRAVTSVDGKTAIAVSDVASVRTGNLPLGLPTLTQSGSGFDGFIVVPVIGQTRSVEIINSKGEIVWYFTDDRQLDFYRARLSVDRKSLIYNAAKISGAPTEASELVRVALDGSQTTPIAIPFLAHDFVEHADGTLAAIAFEDRDFNGTPLRGNKLVEVAPNGSQRTVWTSWNCFDPATVTGDDPTQGWTFANALDYDPVEDVYYVGMRNFSSIAKVNRTSGACEWVLGTYGSTFTYAQGSARFLHEHQFDVHGDHIVIMDNDGAPGDVSRVLEYQLDFTTKVATQVFSYVANPTVYTFVLGEPIRFADGGTFVNWSTAGQMERLDASGASVWKLNTGAGFAFGFQTLASSLYDGGATSPAN